jgi:trk system potassium uptake protein TrkA
VKSYKKTVSGVLAPDYVFQQGDILLIFGKIKDVQDFLDSGS